MRGHFWLLAAAGAALAVGCVPPPPPPVSQGHIQAPPAAATRPSEIPEPVKTAPILPPPPRPTEKPVTYTIVVHQVPVKDLLFSLARDRKINIDIHPAIEGSVTLNAVNETLPAILERISQQVDLRYRMAGNTVSILPDSPFLRTYPVNYVNLVRDTASTIGVTGQIATTGSAAGGASAGGNSSSTTVTSTSKNNFWEALVTDIRAIIAATKSITAEERQRAARAAAEKAAQEQRLAQAEAVSKAGANAPQLFTSVFGAAAASRSDLETEVSTNPVAGTVNVFATERQHMLVQRYLDRVNNAAQRQVLIEASIVEVTLDEKHRAGINWNTFKVGDFQINSANPTNALAGALNPVVTFTYTRTPGASLDIELLESFGDVRVLSSPKLMALNNQTAILKVVDNLVYFTVKSDTSQGTGGSGNLKSFTTTEKTVAVGVILAVTPQINENGLVTLTVRPTITRRLRDVTDPNPDLPADTPNLVPVIQVREMESVLQVLSGQIVILGGLMQDDNANNRDGLPGVSKDPLLGFLFGQKEAVYKKTELVIFLRPTVITQPSLASDELAPFARYLSPLK